MGQHALIADPDPARAALYAGILKQEGLYPLVVKDGAAAISVLLERGPPALVVVDLALGLELIERVRRTAPAAALPIIVVSALRTERDLATTHRVRLGISAILAKAASDGSFRRIVRRLLGISASDESEPPNAAAPASGPTLAPPSEGGAARADSVVRRRDQPVGGEDAAARPATWVGSRR
jgi:DNA-binding response OmpR family regulator